MKFSDKDITGLYERYMKMVYRICYLYLKQPSDAEDAVQTVFIKLIDKGQTFSNDEHIKAWLIRCATNYCKDVLKSAYKKRTDFDIPENIADDATEGKELDKVTEAVMALPDNYKTCVYLHYYEGYKTDEIATLLGKPGSTVRNYLSDARKQLRATLGGELND